MKGVVRLRAHRGVNPPGCYVTPKGQLLTSAACANVVLFCFINSAAVLFDFLVVRVCLEPELELSVRHRAFGMKLPADLHLSLRPQLHPNSFCSFNKIFGEVAVAPFYSSRLHHRYFCKTTQVLPNMRWKINPLWIPGIYDIGQHF